jgi:hypothetical protein
MFMSPIAAYHVRHATEALAHSGRPDAPTRLEPAAGRRWWTRHGRLRLPLAVRRSAARPAPGVD